jgi:hypothetical protein
MPMPTTTERQTPPLRRKRDDHAGVKARPLLHGSEEDGRATPPVLSSLAPRPVLVLHDGGPGGDAAVAHAIHGTRGPLTIVRLWEAADPLVAARLGGGAGGGGELLRVVHLQNEHVRAAAEAEAAAAAAMAEKAGRQATAVVRRLDHHMPLDLELRRLAESRGAAELVMAAPQARRRRLRGRTPQERLAADPPCAITLVPENRS